MSAPALQGSFATSHTVQNVRPPPPAPASPASESESHSAFPSSPNTLKPRGTVTSATGESGSAAENFIWYRPAGTGSIYEATSPTGVADGVGAFGEPPLPAGLDAAQPAVRTINARAAATEILLGPSGQQRLPPAFLPSSQSPSATVKVPRRRATVDPRNHGHERRSSLSRSTLRHRSGGSGRRSDLT